jgi:hypothetical protein
VSTYCFEDIDPARPSTWGACGYPLACLTDDVPDAIAEAFPCTMSQGCFDFSSATPCQANGLITVMASVPGEESFVEADGDYEFNFFEDGEPNGIQEDGEVDFNDATGQVSSVICTTPGSVQNDSCAPGAVRRVGVAIDAPEPFLDKNDSCGIDLYDDVDNGMGFLERFSSSEFYNDVSDDNNFGYVNGDQVRLGNQRWDASSEVFFTDHFLRIGAPQLLFGESCTPNGGLFTCREATSQAGSQSPCVEVSEGVGIAVGCTPRSELTPPASGSYVYAFVDENMNCPSTNFEATTAVSGSGAIVVAASQGDLDALSCGFRSALDRNRPWCEVYPALGAPVRNISFTASCGAGGDGATPGLAQIALTDPEVSLRVEIGFSVNCPEDTAAGP